MLNEIYLSLILNYDSPCLQIFFFFFEKIEITQLTLINYLQLNLN